MAFKQGVAAVFTFYPHGEYQKPKFDESKMKYLVFQGEICPETKELHYQGYVQFKTKIKRKNAQECLGSDKELHMEKVKGTPDQARDYCMKEESRASLPEEFGVFESKGQGKRSDLTMVCEAIKSGIPYEKVEEEHMETCIRYGKALREYVARHLPKRHWLMQVEVRWGDPGSGKSRYVWDNHSDDQVYEPIEGSNCYWFDSGYTGQEVILLDDFNPALQPITGLLKLLDRHPHRRDSKLSGTPVSVCSKTVYITSNQHPTEWYPAAIAAHSRALARRITSITHVGCPNVNGPCKC